MIDVTVNGQGRQVPAGTTLADLVQDLTSCGRGIAVELEGRVIPPSEWGSTELAQGNAVEVIRIVGGG